MARKMSAELVAELEKQLPIASKQTGVPVDRLRLAVEAVIHATVAEGGDAFVEEKAHYLIQAAFDMLPKVEASGPAQKQ